MRVWNNLDPIDATGHDHLVRLKTTLLAHSTQIGFIDVPTDLLDDGLCGNTGMLHGMALSIPICIRCRVRNGKTGRIDEYLSFAAPPPGT